MLKKDIFKMAKKTPNMCGIEIFTLGRFWFKPVFLGSPPPPPNLRSKAAEDAFKYT